LNGSHAKAERNMVDTVNDRMMLQKMHEANGGQMPSGRQGDAFPKTTN
jgi:hypothetical protein